MIRIPILDAKWINTLSILNPNEIVFISNSDNEYFVHIVYKRLTLVNVYICRKNAQDLLSQSIMCCAMCLSVFNELV